MKLNVKLKIMVFWVEAWRWVQQIPENYWYLLTKLHGGISEKTVIFLFIAMITSDNRCEDGHEWCNSEWGNHGLKIFCMKTLKKTEKKKEKTTQTILWLFPVRVTFSVRKISYKLHCATNTPSLLSNKWRLVELHSSV